MTAFLKAYGSWLLVSLLLIAFAVAGYSCSQERTAHANAAAEITRLDTVVTHLTKQTDSLAKVERKDSLIYVTQWRTKYTQVEDTLIRNIHDTVEVLRFVQVADSTIHACQLVLSDCQQRATLLTRQLADADSLTSIYKRTQPSFLQRHLGPITISSLLAGVILGRVLSK